MRDATRKAGRATPRRHGARAGSRGAGLLLALALAAGCTNVRAESLRARRRAPAAAAAARSAGDAVAEGRALLGLLRRHALPAGVEAVATELVAIADAEGHGPRGIEALRLASDLWQERYRLVRDGRDLARARESLARLAREAPAPAACDALAAAGDLAATAGEAAAARARFGEYLRRCPDGPQRRHVQAGLALLAPAPAPPPTDARGHGGPRLRRIVIDPGHGGNDPGAVGPSGLAESAVTLDVARRLAEMLASRLGLDVRLTRDSDVFVPLGERAARANAAGADLFVSLHCNSADNPAGRGVGTYVLDTTSSAVASRVAARENGALASAPRTDAEVFRILASLRLVGQGSRSARVAAAIQRELVAALRREYPDVADLGVQTARFDVLVGARMPAVLVELSFLSNPVEERRLSDFRYRTLLADAIARAIADVAGP